MSSYTLAHRKTRFPKVLRLDDDLRLENTFSVLFRKLRLQPLFPQALRCLLPHLRTHDVHLLVSVPQLLGKPAP